MTALLLASNNDHAAIVQYLVEKGANMDLQNQVRTTHQVTLRTSESYVTNEYRWLVCNTLGWSDSVTASIQ